jgi:alpha/beta hydrolase fold
MAKRSCSRTVSRRRRMCSAICRNRKKENENDSRMVACGCIVGWLLAGTNEVHGQMKDAMKSDAARVTYHTTQVDGLKMFYREAGPKNAPTVVLLHGFRSPSHMFRELIPRLSDKYHVAAPDYPGYGYSERHSRSLRIVAIVQEMAGGRALGVASARLSN